MTYYSIVVAAGKSKRFEGENKIFSNLENKDLLFYSLDFFERQKDCFRVVLASSKENLKRVEKIIKQYGFKKVVLVSGGKTRGLSVLKALKEIKKKENKNLKVLVHNAANPFLFQDEINKLKKKKNAILARKINGTLKISKDKGIIKESLRDNFYCAETPQVSTLGNLLKAYEKFPDSPDEADALQKVGIDVEIVESREQNFKITRKKDLDFAEKIMDSEKVNFRIGIGEDSHKFVSGRVSKDLVLGGVIIKGEKGLVANSDGDVLTHALCNAFLSALGKGSFSQVADRLYKKGEKKSVKYLGEILKENIFSIENVSISLEAKSPKLEHRFPEIKESLSSVLKITGDRIGITATSGEGLTDFGRGRGIAVRVVVMIKN